MGVPTKGGEDRTDGKHDASAHGAPVDQPLETF